MGKINNWRIFLRINLLKMSCGKRWKCHFRDPKFQNFLEEHAPRPLSLGHPFGSTTFSPSCVHAQNLTLRPWFIFHDVYKKQGRSSSKSDYKVQKTKFVFCTLYFPAAHLMCGRKIYSRTRTFGSKVHKSNIRVKRWHNKYEILNYTERHNLSLNDFSYHVQS